MMFSSPRKATAAAGSSSSSSSRNTKNGSKKSPPHVTVHRGEVFFHLGGEKSVTVNNFRSKTLVHIRKFFQAENGELYPTKTGITLSTDEFERLNRQLGEINQQIEKMKGKQQQQQQHQHQHQQQQREKSTRKRVGGQDDSKISCSRVPTDANKRRKLQLRLEDIHSQMPGDTEVEIEETSPPPATQWQPEEQLIFGMSMC